MDTKERVRGFLRDNFYIEGELDDRRSLLAQGVVDSTGILEVIAFLEEGFEIAVDDTEMTPDNLDSVDAIVGFVDRKTGGAGAAEARGA